MANARMLPPGHGKLNTIKVNGRLYNVAPGGYVDVMTFDADTMGANGWTRAGGPECLVGSTAGRPTARADGQPIPPGQQYIDTTLGAQITWDTLGNVWRNNVTGAAV